MVIGLVKVIAKEVYDLNVNMSLVDSIEEGAEAFPYHYKLSIDMIETRRRGRSNALGRTLCVCVRVCESVSECACVCVCV